MKFLKSNKPKILNFIRNNCQITGQKMEYYGNYIGFI